MSKSSSDIAIQLRCRSVVNNLTLQLHGMSLGKNAGMEQAKGLVTVVVGLVGTFHGDAQVLRLFARQLRQLDIESTEMGGCDFLVKLLWQHVDTNGVGSGVGPQLDLGEDLIGEGVGHDEGRMTHGAPKINKPSLGKQDNVLAVLEGVSVDLWLDIGLQLAVLLEPLDLDFTIEMPNVANDGIILHLNEVLAGDDIGTAGGCDEDVAPGDTVLHGGHLVSLHGCLESVDGVDFSDDDPATESPQGLCRALAYITVASNNSNLSSQHHICGPLDTINKRLPATVQVVEL